MDQVNGMVAVIKARIQALALDREKLIGLVNKHAEARQDAFNRLIGVEAALQELSALVPPEKVKESVSSPK